MPAFGSYKKRQEKPEINDIPQWQKVFQQVVSDDIAAAKNLFVGTLEKTMKVCFNYHNP